MSSSVLCCWRATVAAVALININFALIVLYRPAAVSVRITRKDYVASGPFEHILDDV
jgi:hypothetical protein